METNDQLTLNWAVLGTGAIANEMAAAWQTVGRSFYAVGNRTYEKAVAFAERYGIHKVYDRYDEVFTDPCIDVIYLATPHNTHYSFMKRALENGKHLLVEKSIALNSRELEEMSALAQRNHLVLAEAMTIWHMPLYKKLWETVDSGKLGKVQLITASFGSFKEYNMNSRFFDMELAGGALLDIGVYALSAVRSFMRSQPNQIMSQMRLSPAGSDEQATILLMNQDGQMASIALSLHSKQPKQVVISCEKGYIEITEYPRADHAVIVDAQTGAKEELLAGDITRALLYEIEDMEEAILRGKTELMKLSASRDVMAVMTHLRKEWGLQYPGEIW